MNDQAFIEATFNVRERFAFDPRLNEAARRWLDNMYRHAVLGNRELAQAAGRKAYKILARRT